MSLKRKLTQSFSLTLAHELSSFFLIKSMLIHKGYPSFYQDISHGKECLESIQESRVSWYFKVLLKFTHNNDSISITAQSK